MMTVPSFIYVVYMLDLAGAESCLQDGTYTTRSGSIPGDKAALQNFLGHGKTIRNHAMRG